MDIELVQYINTLLAEKQRKVEHRNKRLNEIEIGSYTDNYLERHFHELQENDYELSIIYRCQKAMDYLEEEN
jgi:hypothetical protein|tara:strand:+ start:90 stop:305 length:216 start_codon:yes stop_codon:yes gene_type:complete